MPTYFFYACECRTIILHHNKRSIYTFIILHLFIIIYILYVHICIHIHSAKQHKLVDSLQKRAFCNKLRAIAIAVCVYKACILSVLSCRSECCSTCTPQEYRLCALGIRSLWLIILKFRKTRWQTKICLRSPRTECRWLQFGSLEPITLPLFSSRLTGIPSGLYSEIWKISLITPTPGQVLSRTGTNEGTIHWVFEASLETIPQRCHLW